MSQMPLIFKTNLVNLFLFVWYEWAYHHLFFSHHSDVTTID